MNEQPACSPADPMPSNHRKRHWRRLGLFAAGLLLICAGIWLAIPCQGHLVAIYHVSSGQPFSVSAHGFLYPVTRRMAQYRDWHGRVLAVYQSQEDIAHAAISPDGRTVALLGTNERTPSALQQWYDGRLRYKTRVTLLRYGGGFPVLTAHDNGDLVFLLHDETPLPYHYYSIQALMVIRHGKAAASRTGFTRPSEIAADAHMIIQGNKLKRVQVIGKRLAMGHLTKAVLPPASRMANNIFTTMSSDATWGMIAGGEYCSPTPTKHITVWNLRTGKSWSVDLPRAVKEPLGSITDDGEYLAIRADDVPAGRFAPLLRRLPAHTPFRAALITSRPAILVYQRPGRCCAVIPITRPEEISDYWCNCQMQISSDHRAVVITAQRGITLYRW